MNPCRWPWLAHVLSASHFYLTHRHRAQVRADCWRCRRDFEGAA